MPSSRLRVVLFAAAATVVVALVVLRGLVLDPLKDFVEYWAAGVVNLDRGNPYDGEQILRWQRLANGDPGQTGAVMMWNPPWALPLVSPLGLLPVRAAYLVWLVAQLAAVLLSAAWLWRVYGGPRGKRWVAWLLALLFAPFLVQMWFGQVGGLCLLGLAGFLRHRVDGKPFAAGAFAALTALKPHLLFAFGVVLVLDGATRAGRRALVGGAAALGACAVIAWFINPTVYDDYAAALWKPDSTAAQVQPRDWKLPLASYWLRVGVGRLTGGDEYGPFWVQFVPTAVAAVVVCGYWLGRRRRWDWPAEMPMLVFVSVLLAAYGAWLFDLVVLLVPVLAAAARLGNAGAVRPAVAVGVPYAVANLTGLYGGVLHYYIWFAPVMLGLYVAAVRPARSTGL